MPNTDPDESVQVRSNTLMRLSLQLPTEELVNEDVIKIIAQAVDGSFCLLPRHADFVTALVPGLLHFCTTEGEDVHLAVDRGLLVKCGQDVYVSALAAVRGNDLDHLQSLVRERFLELDEAERKARTALARLEAGALRGFMELKEGGLRRHA